MQRSEGTFPSFDGTKLYYRFFTEPCAEDLLLILHGHGEHGGRYEKFAKELEGERVSIAIHDVRGQGRSGGREVYVEHFEDFVKDVTAFVDFLAAKHGVHSKIFLLGHSLGGLVAIHWARQAPEKIRALILSSPCLGLALPKAALVLNRFINSFAPAFLYQNPVYPPHLTHNPEEVEHYRKDTYIKRKISARLLAEMLGAMDALDRNGRSEFPFPVAVIMSGLEKVVDGAKTRQFIENLQAPLKEVKIFPDFYHEAFNELGQEQAFSALRSFLAKVRARP